MSGLGVTLGNDAKLPEFRQWLNPYFLIISIPATKCRAPGVHQGIEKLSKLTNFRNYLLPLALL
jgi:hypothetical protein